MNRIIATLVVSLVATLALAPRDAGAHEEAIGLGGKSIKIDTSKGLEKNKLVFKSEKQTDVSFAFHDPVTEPTALLIRWMGANGQNAGRTPLIQLNNSMWSSRGTKGFKYSDKSYSAGGVKTAQLKASSAGGNIKIIARGDNLAMQLVGAQDSLWVHFMIDDEWYCTEFVGESKKNDGGLFQAKGAPRPVSGCPSQICGNGITELGESCDDGNLNENDDCANDCTILSCDTTEYASTFEAIQQIIFEGYGCTNSLCHGAVAPQNGLDLTAANSYANLVGVPSQGNPLYERVKPGDQDTSVLYDRLHAGTFAGIPAFGGSPMPTGGALTPAHLEAVERWINGGAPEDLVVAGTASLLATCLPDPDPLTIPIPDPPGAGVGVQFRMTPWPLFSQTENEICMATYYDLTQTDLVPEEAKISCTLGIENNPSGECFLYHRQALSQDPQSHHSIIDLYTGQYDTTDPGWGPWTLKFQDQSNPLEGQSCDPTVVDPATGYAPDCSGRIVKSIACIGYGPPDNNAQNTSPLSGSQQAYYDQEFADGVYAVAPMAGIIQWNSHAFNTTTADTTMSQYLNLDFAGVDDQVALVQRVFNINQIFTQNVPPFEQREYCWNHTIPSNSNLFDLSSHTHRFGVEFRIYEPPNGTCSSAASCPPGAANRLIYVSTEYSDPERLVFDPPVHFGNLSANDRRFRYCSRYDNGSGPGSPAVKQASDPVGSSCAVGVRACMAGPNKGQLCGGSDSFCDSTPGAGDGLCDACPVVGGFTTADEMFILLGGYYLDP